LLRSNHRGFDVAFDNPAVWAGTGKAALALVCAVDGAAFLVSMGILPPAPVRDAMLPDLNRLFPMRDLPSARLMKLKAFCLFRAGVQRTGDDRDSRKGGRLCAQPALSLGIAPAPRRLICRCDRKPRHPTCRT